MSEESQNILSIHLNTDCFKYTSVGNVVEESQKAMTWKTDVSLSLTANLRRFFQENEALCNSQQVNVVLETTRYVTVPAELFEEEHADMLFYHSLPQHDNETILFDRMPSVNVVLIYAMDTNSFHLLLAQFPNVSCTAYISSMVSHLCEKSRLSDHRNMYVNLSKDSIDILCFDKGKLLLANSFASREVTDKLYYIMYAWMQTGMSQESDVISFLGLISTHATLFELIDKYIRHRFTVDADEQLLITS